MMKYKLLIILFIILSSCVGKPNMITNKIATDTIYVLSSYKSSDLYLTKEMFISLRLSNLTNNNFNRLHIKYPTYTFVLDGDYVNRIEVSQEIYSVFKEGKIYKK
jgi:uncharacterized protein YcfL